LLHTCDTGTLQVESLRVGGSKTRRISATAALLALIMYLAKPVLQSSSILAIGRCIGQTVAKFVFSVAKVLAMLPPLPIVVLLSSGRRAKPRYLRDWNLNVRLPWRQTLGISCRLKECAGEHGRGDRAKTDLHVSYSPVSMTNNP
jgi:hypothetical protein